MKILELMALKRAAGLPEGSPISEQERDRRITSLEQSAISSRLEGVESDITPQEAELIGRYVDGWISDESYVRDALRMAYEYAGRLGGLPQETIESMIDEATKGPL